ncbi:MAG: hypothetical protein GTO18_12730 [Anaerolineales bacterium]|nr:hypothetical protein [Anaerolineales bacterium]
MFPSVHQRTNPALIITPPNPDNWKATSDSIDYKTERIWVMWHVVITSVGLPDCRTNDQYDIDGSGVWFAEIAAEVDGYKMVAVQLGAKSSITPSNWVMHGKAPEITLRGRFTQTASSKRSVGFKELLDGARAHHRTSLIPLEVAIHKQRGETN